MATQTTFDLEDAKELQKQLAAFNGTLQRELGRIENQWINLKSTWHDDQYNNFSNNFLEKFLQTCRKLIRECESYEKFLNDEVQSAESIRVKLGSIMRNIGVGLEIAQTAVSLVTGSSQIQALAQTGTVPSAPLTSQCQASPKKDSDSASDANLSKDSSAPALINQLIDDANKRHGIDPQFDELDNWRGVIDNKKEDENEKLLTMPDHPEISGSS